MFHSGKFGIHDEANSVRSVCIGYKWSAQKNVSEKGSKTDFKCVCIQISSRRNLQCMLQSYKSL